MTSNRYAPLPMLGRLYIYGLHGFSTEILFTAGWEFVVNLNFKFPGNTSLWSFLIYGFPFLVAEPLREYMIGKKIPLFLRAFVFVFWAYACELLCGLILKPLGMNSWDYSPFTYNFMGIITLEYFPAWYIGALITDSLLIPFSNSLFVTTTPGNENGFGKMKGKSNGRLAVHTTKLKM